MKCVCETNTINELNDNTWSIEIPQTVLNVANKILSVDTCIILKK